MEQKLEQFPYKSNYINIQGYRYHYVVEGKPSNSAVLLLHGNPTWGFYFRELIAKLRDYFYVIAPDHLGMGLSDKPQQFPYNLRNHINNVQILVETLGVKKINLVMHDWGGLIGAGYALENIQKIGKLVVLNSAAFYVPKLPFYLKVLRNPFIGKFCVQKLNLFLLGTLKWGVSDPSIMSDEIKQGYLYPYNNERNRIGILKFLQDIPFESSHPTRALLNSIDNNLHLLQNHPMLILWGMDDPVFKAKYFLAEWKKRFPSAQEYRLKGGHLVLEENGPQTTRLIMEFLS